MKQNVRLEPSPWMRRPRWTTFAPLLVVIFAIAACSPSEQESSMVKTVPNPRTNNTWVSDPAHKLSDSDKSRINAQINSLERQTSAEIAVVILPSIGDEVPKDFAVELFNHWGIGKKGKDNGLLLLIILDQRRWEFETGYGLEGDLPDATLKRIGESNLVPALRAGRMGDGIYDALNAVMEKLGAKVDRGEDMPTQHTTKGSLSGDTSAKPASSDTSTEAAENATEGTSSMNNLFGLNADEQTAMAALSGLYSLIVIVAGFFIFKNAKKNKPKASGWTYARNTFFWLIPAILFVSAVYFTRPEWMAIIYYPVGAAWAAVQRIVKNRGILSAKGEPYELYKNLRTDHGGLFFASVFLFPIPMAFLALYYSQKLKSLRNAPRACPQCSAALHRLDEKADDVFLDEGQRKEEQLASVDYDVWHCSACEHFKIFPYDAFFTSYSACPSCRYKTYHTVADRTIVSPTCSSSGRGERDYKCEQCGSSRTESYTIPKRDCSKSSSSGGSSGGSSSGGGSFGGGSSGGGGAGGSW